ncbi:MAG: thiamine-phosphate kinase [Pontiellaceae bacterium]|nr:thiamine-phosphate kinase [Pontiellaceae bacterium]MBN2786463.1 thiamine-phosphate kinase [Pontiellaceae bacterium]
MLTLGDIGEHEAICRLVKTLGNHAELVVPAGDDCAVVRLSGGLFDQVFTTDPVIEHVHFLPGHEPRRIGNKAVGRVLSDIAAMGAQPQWLLVNVVAPKSVSIERLEAIYEGMQSLAGRFGATIIGGDLAEGPVLELHVFGTGILPAGSALLRSGARLDDVLLVTGRLGGSIEGHHLDFIPRVEQGMFLRESGLVHAMMDISDGLATDLRHILAQSSVGAVVEASSIPATGSLEQALYDGEDFELLVAVAEADVQALLNAWNARFDVLLTAIGRVTAHSGELCLKRENHVFELLEKKAFEHFSG